MAKILIIEDDKDLSDLLRMEFEYQKHNVVCSHDGEDGYKKYQDEQPDLIILDLRLPKLTGGALCRQIRREHHDEKTKIIMLTGELEETDRIIGKVQGANKYMTKPFDRKQLVDTVKELLEAT